MCINLIIDIQVIIIDEIILVGTTIQRKLLVYIKN